MLILGIESSCDDTSVALVDCSDNGHVVVSEKTASQIQIHQKYGGVVPEIAGRMHAEKIVPLIESVLEEAKESPLGRGVPRDEGRGGSTSSFEQTSTHPGSRQARHPAQAGILPDAIAVTAGPGLLTGLIVGVEAAQTLSYAWNVPLVAVNHIAGHIHSPLIRNPKLETGESKSQFPISNFQFPSLALVVSGGHTELVLMQSNTEMKILGRTKDDAAGECFDKIAKLLGLPYPGGPEISRLAQKGKTDAIAFPRPMLRENNYDFSFAGLKTSALYWLRDHGTPSSFQEEDGRSSPRSATGVTFAQETATLPNPLLEREGSNVTLADFCASFEQAITDVVVGKTMKAVAEFKPKTVILGGGVSANKKIRETLVHQITDQSPITYFLLPTTSYCMDNAAMIAVAGYYKAKNSDFTPWQDIKADPNWRVDQKMA